MLAKKDLTLPPWFEVLRGVDADRPKGPSFGPAMEEAVFETCELAGVDYMSFLWSVLTRPSDFIMRDGLAQGVNYTTMLLPGHVGYGPVEKYRAQKRLFHYGPSPGCADVVVVGKHPGREEMRTLNLFSGPSGLELRDALKSKNVPDFIEHAYVTNICRFMPPDGKFKKSWIHECAWFLWAELQIIRPKLIVLLGSDAIQAFHGRHLNVGKARGAALAYTMEGIDSSGKPETIVLKTFSTMHPAAVAREPSMRDGMASDLAQAHSLLSGVTQVKDPTSYRVLKTLSDVSDWVKQMLAQDQRKFAIDCEWTGRSVWSGGRLLTIQFSWAWGQAACLPLRRHVRLPLPMPASLVASEQVRFHNLHIAGQDHQFAVFPRLDGVDALRPEITKEAAVALATSVLASHTGLVHLDAPGGAPVELEVLTALVNVFSTAELAEVVALLQKLLLRPEVRVGGHNFRADFPWLKALGIDLTHQFVEADGFDTMLMHHMLFESGSQGLDALCAKFCDAGRYEMTLENWIQVLKLDREMGFGCIPEHVLYTYGNADADVTFRSNERMLANYSELQPGQPLHGRCEAERRSCLGILEIEETGMLADRDRLMQLAEKYAAKRIELHSALRVDLKWPGFNYRSVQQVRELLFGEAFNGAKRLQPNVPRRLRPEGTESLNLVPIKSTGKPAMDWQKVIAHGKANVESPSTDKETLGILAEQSPVADALRKIRFVDQVCKNFAALPHVDPDTGEYHEAGLTRFIDLDGRIRTHILQITETGRWASTKVNLQNIIKRREADLKALFAKSDQPHSMRSIFMASPGRVLIEADIMQAELVVLALLSGDPKFWDVLMVSPIIPVLMDIASGKPYRWLHPEWVSDLRVNKGDIIPAGFSGGRYKKADGGWETFHTDVETRVEMRKWPRDLHAEGAITNFRIPYSAVVHGPPKDFAEVNAKEKRVASKTINFGIPYGRCAAAIARELRQDGVTIGVDECQAVIDGFLTTYDLVDILLKRCRACVREGGVLINPHGRRRRFQDKAEEEKLAAQEREAANFPIQSTVAECLNDAVFNVWWYRQMSELGHERYPWVDFKLVLGVHDALIFEAAPESVHEMVRSGGMIDYCMCDIARIPCPPRDVCHGVYNNADPAKFPYALSVDKNVTLRWDDRPNFKKDPVKARELHDTMAAMGVPEAYLPELG